MIYKQMLNPKGDWFALGIIAKKECNMNAAYDSKTFYGASTADQWWLNGGYGSNREEIKKRENIYSFVYVKDGEIDIYVNNETNQLKMCLVGASYENKEVVIDGIDKSGNKDGWVPSISFGYSATSIRVRICSIDVECYGQSMDIDWGKLDF